MRLLGLQGNGRHLHTQSSTVLAALKTSRLKINDTEAKRIKDEKIFYPFPAEGLLPLEKIHTELAEELHIDSQDLWTDLIERKDLVDSIRQRALDMVGFFTSIHLVGDPNFDPYVLKNLHEGINRDKHIKALFENNPLLFSRLFDSELIHVARILFKHILFLELLDRKNTYAVRKVIDYLHSVSDSDSERVKKAFIESKKKEDRDSIEWAQNKLATGLEPELEECMQTRAFSYFNRLITSTEPDEFLSQIKNEWTERRLKSLSLLYETEKTPLPLLKQIDEVERRMHEVLGNKNFSLVSNHIREDLINSPNPEVQEIFNAAIEKTILAFSKVRDEELMILEPLLKIAKKDRTRLWILGGVGVLTVAGATGLVKYLGWRINEASRAASIMDENVEKLEALVTAHLDNVEIDLAQYIEEARQELKTNSESDLNKKYFKTLAKYLEPVPPDKLIKTEIETFLKNLSSIVPDPNALNAPSERLLSLLRDEKDYKKLVEKICSLPINERFFLPHVLKGLEELRQIQQENIPDTFRDLVHPEDWYYLYDVEKKQVRPTYGQLVGACILVNPGAYGTILGLILNKNNYSDEFLLEERRVKYSRFVTSSRLVNDEILRRMQKATESFKTENKETIERLQQLRFLMTEPDVELEPLEKELLTLTNKLRDKRQELDLVLRGGADCIVRFEELETILK